jgi:hypothetical protein
MTPFIQEYLRLQESTPRIGILNVNSENSNYTNYSSYNKNCYLCFGTHYSEDCYFLGYSVGNTDCVDCEDVEKSELLYECVLCEKSYNCSYSSYLIACSDCDFCWDMSNSTNCFLSTGMQGASYCILNQQLSPEEYAKKKAFLLKQHSAPELLQQLEDLRKKIPQRAAFHKNSENCEGSDLRHCKNVHQSFGAKNSEDCIYTCKHVNNVKDSVDIECIAADPSEEIYNSIGVSGGNNIMCSWIVWFSNDISYCEQIWSSHDLFGCIGRNHAEYQILNQQYTKDEYFKKTAEIKDQLAIEGLWGKIWFNSTYPYEDSMAASHFS